MSLLNEEMINEMIPQCGTRVKFLLKWNEFYGKNKSETSQVSFLIEIKCKPAISTNKLRHLVFETLEYNFNEIKFLLNK